MQGFGAKGRLGSRGLGVWSLGVWGLGLRVRGVRAGFHILGIEGRLRL